jgi:hypothetical protein
MADIAAVFHWPLSALEAMSLDELLLWQARAIARFKSMHGEQG